MMREISIEERATIAARLAGIAAVIDLEEKRLRPLEEQMRPIKDAIAAAEERRELLLEEHGVEIAGFCEHDGCGRLIFVGEQGSRPYADETDVVFCADHAMTYDDLKRHWEDLDADKDHGEEGEMRTAALALVASHIADGGSLDDKIPGVL